MISARAIMSTAAGVMDYLPTIRYGMRTHLASTDDGMVKGKTI
jgi:hypothetical protein